MFWSNSFFLNKVQFISFTIVALAQSSDPTKLFVYRFHAKKQRFHVHGPCMEFTWTMHGQNMDPC